MTETPPTSPAEDLELLRSGAVAAGIIAAGFFRRDLKTWTKANASPVTEADITVDRYLHALLSAARPGYGWLSEETADDSRRLDRRRVFIVDPIDGTRGFIRGEDSWTISLAVVEDGRPIAGVVYAPARDELYEASEGGGARCNGAPLTRGLAGGRTAPLIPGPAAVHGELEAAGLNYTRGPYLPSLAYRLVQVARGELDAVTVRRGASDWDIAGAAAILSECGIDFADVCKPDLRFNNRDVRHGALAATANISIKAVLHGALVRIYGCPADDVAEIGSGTT
ncbi:MAG TPA: 3'(2'),5'-bisphosphate nucleotidase CysQ [Devosiaceae bacterium]|jgi:myo-inositol-1(or 4)-monophosphatase|nr:3'(2'),5'-bisphosphate nucleotidase CysQ [Devosiaceae bacterium]